MLAREPLPFSPDSTAPRGNLEDSLDVPRQHPRIDLQPSVPSTRPRFPSTYGFVIIAAVYYPCFLARELWLSPSLQSKDTVPTRLRQPSTESHFRGPSSVGPTSIARSPSSLRTDFLSQHPESILTYVHPSTAALLSRIFLLPTHYRNVSR